MPTRPFLFSVVLALFATLLRADSPPPSPAIQEQAPEWLEIRVTAVNLGEPSEDGKAPVKASAEVTSVYKSASGLKAGDTISIVYLYTSNPMPAPGSRPKGPSAPVLLREGRTTTAFLTADSEGEKTYKPAADAWSFAPPFGISPQDREKYGLKIPTPPSTPPPPPPSFRAPLKGPQPPNAPRPGNTPPPPPPPPAPAPQQQNAE